MLHGFTTEGAARHCGSGDQHRSCRRDRDRCWVGRVHHIGANARLELLPSTLTIWEAWKEAHPEAVALDVHAWATGGFHLEDMAIVVDLGTESAAYLIPPLRAVSVVNDVVAGIEIAVVIDPGDPQRWAVFSRRLDDAIVSLAMTDGELVDTIAGTVFDPFLGLGRSASSAPTA